MHAHVQGTQLCMRETCTARLLCPSLVLCLLQEQLHASYEVLEEMLYRSAAPVNWPSLFQPDDFFNKFKLYLQIEVWAASEQMFRPWSGWVQSR